MTPSQEGPALTARLRGARRAARLSQEQAAAALGVARAVISAMENGKRRVTALELARLARAYGTTAAWLLGEAQAGDSGDEAVVTVAAIMSRLGCRDRSLLLRYARFTEAHPYEGGCKCR